jgi:hypothetical protein
MRSEKMSKSLMAVTLVLQLPLAAQANGGQPLTSGGETARPVQTEGQTVSPSSSEGLMLYGAVKKHSVIPDDNASANVSHSQLHGAANTDGASLQSEQAGADDLFKLALQKLANRQKLSSQEFRSLGVGVNGFEADQKFFQYIAKVTAVYEDSPADKAGIKVGDKLEEKRNPVYEARWKANPTQPLFQVSFEPVGARKDFTVLRDGEKIPITLYAMNMEDIKEPKIRRMWEKMVSRLGYPQGGDFLGTSLHNLSQVP